jgi:NADPH:quinone reductase-like Zn-dependent oxidoreductase
MIFTTASQNEKLDFLMSLPNGPTHTINYRTEDFAKRVKEATGGKGVDVIIDFVGRSHWNKNLESLGVDGRMVMLALLSGQSFYLSICPPAGSASIIQVPISNTRRWLLSS